MNDPVHVLVLHQLGEDERGDVCFCGFGPVTPTALGAHQIEMLSAAGFIISSKPSNAD